MLFYTNPQVAFILAKGRRYVRADDLRLTAKLDDRSDFNKVRAAGASLTKAGLMLDSGEEVVL